MAIITAYLQRVPKFNHELHKLRLKVGKPARGQLNTENEYFPVPICAW